MSKHNCPDASYEKVGDSKFLLCPVMVKTFLKVEFELHSLHQTKQKGCSQNTIMHKSRLMSLELIDVDLVLLK